LQKALAIFLGGDSGYSVEKTDEVTVVTEAQLVGYLFHITVGSEEEQLCPFHLLPIDILNGRQPKLLFEKADEIGLGDRCYIGQLLHVYLIEDMFMDMPENAFHAFIGCPNARFRLSDEV
jgi:hypothetical protein